MKVNINIKGVSNRQNKIMTIEYVYPDVNDKQMTLSDFLIETVKITLKKYNENKDADQIMKLLSKENIEDKALTGKIDFGINYGENKIQEKDAIDNAIQCFEDGLIAVFIDDVRYEKLEQLVAIKEGSSVTFIRLTFLAGRMW